MAINFPATGGQPTDGSFTYTAAGITYSWNGESWTSFGGGGPQGIQGIQGIQGTTGSGTQGTTGSVGLQGTQGSSGGPQGTQGIQGTTGSVGVQGTQGTTGSGTQGTDGSVGLQGIQGPAGIGTGGGSQGTQGIQGTTGSVGIQGTDGSVGLQGTQGAAGIGTGGGSQGTQGIQGTIGSVGVQGTQGTTGSGTQGTSGSIGIQGTQGTQGPAGVGTGASSDKIAEGNTEAEVVDTGSDGHFKVTTEGVEKFRVSSTGKVGIGTTNPNSYSIFADNLVISGSSNEGITINSGISGNIQFNRPTDLPTTWRGKISYSNVADSLTLTTNTLTNVTGLTIDKNGNVGVQTFPNGIGNTFSSEFNVDGNATITGNVTAAQFVGDGSGLTNIIGVGSGVVVQEEGSPVGTASTINFVGSGVTATLSSGTATISIASGGGGGSIASRTTATSTILNAGVGSTSNITITGYKTYALLKAEVSNPAWVTLYCDTSSRTADSSRLITEDPAAGSGVIAEVITTSTPETVLFTPTTIGFNNDGTPSSNIYAKVVNRSGIVTSISVSLTIVQLES